VIAFIPPYLFTRASLTIGFNDKGESIPFQGGTNEEVVDRLYKVLSKEKKEQYLKVYWYTGKDQVRPLNAVKKQRNCHIKFAAYDDEVMIIGNGNQGGFALLTRGRRC